MSLAAVFALTLAAPPLTAEASLSVRWPGSPSVAPDGRVAFELKDVDPEDGSFKHVYILDGSRLRAVTQTGRSNGSPAWSPDGKRLAFVGERDGKAALLVFERGQVGDAKSIATLSTGIGGPTWSADGKTIVFTSWVDPTCANDACNETKAKAKADRKVKARVYDHLLYRHWSGWDEGTRSHVFAVPADGSAAPRDLTRGPHAAPTDILRSGRGYTVAENVVVFSQNVETDKRARSTNNDLYNVSLAGGRPERITSNPALDGNPVASPSGRYVAYIAYARAGFEADRPVLHIHDRRTSKVVARTKDWDRGVREIAWSHDEATLFVVAYERGYRQLYRLGRDEGPVEPIVTGRYVKNVAVGKNGDVVFVASSYTEPPELWRWRPNTKKATPITSLNAAFAKKYALGAMETLEAKSKDGTAVHGFVVKPPNFVKGRRYPLLMLIHGGPQGAWTSNWHPRWNPQLFAAPGYVVALPNPRGSVGEGQAYVDAVTKDWGGKPYEDVIAFTDAAEKLPYVDKRKVCAAGASYGGYMINWIAGHTTRFDCLISHAGVYNLESFWGDTEELWFPEWEFGGPPWSNREMYERWSPHLSIEAAKTPTLVIHGQLDYRVHLSQGQQMFTALRRLGVPARFLYFPDEGHWITKPHNFVFWYGEMLSWLDRYL